MEDYEYNGVPEGRDVLESARGIPNYINGYIKVAEPDVELA